jgi:hypothetical protein
MERKIASLVVASTVLTSALSARDLEDLIPGLYGRSAGGFDGQPGIQVGSADGHEAHFNFGSAAALRALNEQLGRDFTAFPFNSASGNFNFQFDPDLGTFVSTTDTLGPIFAERGQTLSKRTLNLAFSFTFFDYDSFNGESLDNFRIKGIHIPSTIPPVDENNPGTFEEDTVNIRLKVKAAVKIYSFIANYGITDSLEVGALVPIVDVGLKVRSHWDLVVSPDNPTPDVHNTNPENGAEPQNDRAQGSAVGVGDIVLRTKYQFVKNKPFDMAAAVLVKLPTGDEANFLGTGDTTVRPLLAASRTFPELLGKHISITPHANLGFEFNVNDSDRNSLEYAVGAEAGAKRVTVDLDFLGSRRDDGQHRVATSLGAKWNVWKQLTVSANVILPLNDDGLRSDLITTAGAEYSFKF